MCSHHGSRCSIGIIVGIMNLTGLGIRFSNMVLAAGTNLFFALVLMALASLVLEYGPTQFLPRDYCYYYGGYRETRCLKC